MGAMLMKIDILNCHFIEDIFGGAMHQKMVIFRVENSVWCGTNFSHYQISNITKWQYFLDELNLKFKNKTCQENESHITKIEGAMLMKIVTLLRDNWSHITKISNITNGQYFLDELHLKFKNKTCRYNY